MADNKVKGSNFEVKNDVIEKALKALGDQIKGFLPKGWGFTLMLFDTDTTRGSMFYISSANRDDMIKAMKEFIKKNEEA